MDRLDAPVWVSDARRRLCWVNESAADLLGVDGDDWSGRPCHALVAGDDENRCRVCTARCAPMRAALDENALSPITLEVGPPQDRRCVDILLVPVRCDDGETLLVHCAIETPRAHRISDYLSRVARRTPREASGFGRGSLRPLSAREREVLEHLARDEDLPTIARQLHISLVTVRNHVQHLLAAMGVHSVAEAVARYLLQPSSANGDLP